MNNFNVFNWAEESNDLTEKSFESFAEDHEEDIAAQSNNFLAYITAFLVSMF